MGHVPKSPSYREVEFEGLLRSNGSKVLSLNKPGTSGSGSNISPVTTGILSPVTTDERPSTPRPAPAARTTVTISTPLYTQPREETDNDKPPAPPGKDKGRDTKLERSTSDSPLSPTSARKLASRFRVHPSFRRSGIVPPEYAEAIVDFETRLASYSDDELNNVTPSSAGDREEKRRSRDDAWVDILVATHNRRMGGQDVEMRQRGARGKVMQDPAIASLEVAQVLAGVRARSPMSDDEPEPIPEPSAAPSMMSEDVDVDSVMSYPRTVTSSVKKRLGYFDLHPERRPVPSPKPMSLGEDSDGDDEVRYGSPDMSSPSKFPIPPKTDTSSYSQPMRSSIETEESNYAPTSTHSLELAYEDHHAAKEEESVRRITGGLALQQLMASAPMTPEKGEKERSRTSALIEMYREREKKSSMTTPLPTLRPPVRSASLPTPTKDTALPPVPVVEPEPVVVTPVGEIVEEPVVTPVLQDEEFLQPLNLLYNGRDSPARYVHGAPLHNVIEEEEEE